jgi:hypothetical protein
MVFTVNLNTLTHPWPTQDVLYSLKKPVQSIVGADGHLIVFRKVSG